MVVTYLLILLPVLIVFVSAMLIILLKYKGFIEEDLISETKLVSPAFKLIRNVITRTLLSIEIILILLTIYILSFTVSYTSTFSYTSQQLDIRTDYSFLMFKKGYVEIEQTNLKIRNFISVYQIFKGFNIENSTYYPLLIKCSFADYQGYEHGLTGIINEVCGYLSYNYAVVNFNCTVSKEAIVKTVGIPLNLVKLDLTKLINLELAPGVYLVHSIGTVGGLTLRIENADELLLLPMSEKAFTALCPYECDVQTIILGFDPVEELQTSINEMLKFFDYVILSSGGEAVIISQGLIPTVKTISGLILSLVISMIVMYAVGGGFLEKMLSIYNNLYVLGITRHFFRSIVLLGTLIAFFLTSLPMIAVVWVGLVNGIALLNYMMSSTAFMVITSYKFRIAGKMIYPEVVGGYNYIVDVAVPINVLINCLKNMLSEDDFFLPSEVEWIKEEKFNVVRVELIYKKALSTLVSTEIYIDKVNKSVRYNIVVDVWSLEESSSQFLSSIQRLALSKISGGVVSCIES